MEDTGDDEEAEAVVPEAEAVDNNGTTAEVADSVVPEAKESAAEAEIEAETFPSTGGEGESTSLESHAWRSSLLDQANKRDSHFEGLLALYEQYSKCQRHLQAMDHKSSNQRLAQEASVAAATDAASQELLRNSEQLMRQKDAEVQALQRQNKELQEELHEKELAHAQTGREATRLSQENGRLKTELEKMREQLRHAGEALTAAPPEASVRAYASAEVIERRRDPVELPEEPKVRCNLQTELTCVSAGLQSCDALPRTLVAIGTSDGYVKLVDGVTGRLEAHLSVARQLPKVVDLDLAEGSGLLLAASSDQVVRLLDLSRRRLVHNLRGHRGLVSACGWLQGSRAFTAGADRTVKLWDVEKGQILRSIPLTGPVTTARAHSSGVVVTGYADGRLSVIDPRLPEAAEAVRLHQSAQAVVGVQPSHDGNWVLSQAQDGSLCCTSLGSHEPTLRLQASGPLDSGPSPPAFSPDGAQILARGAASVHCWTKDGELVFNHDLQPAVAVSWELHQAISIHRSGHFYIWGSEASSTSRA